MGPPSLWRIRRSCLASRPAALPQEIVGEELAALGELPCLAPEIFLGPDAGPAADESALPDANAALAEDGAPYEAVRILTAQVGQ